MEVDTVTAVSETAWEKLFLQELLQMSDIHLKTYTAESLSVVAVLYVCVDW